MTYSYSWSHELEQEWTWSERYAAQPEILRYLEHVADRFDLRRDIRFAHARRRPPRSTRTRDRWSVTTDGGERLSARFLIMATAASRCRACPTSRASSASRASCTTPGSGRTSGVDFAGKRVGIIGTGSSAVQAIPVDRRGGRAADRVPAHRRTSACRPGTARSAPRPIASGRRATPSTGGCARDDGGGNPWNAREQSVCDATPEEREREFEARYARRRLLPPRGLLRPVLRRRGQRARVRVRPRQDPRARARPGDWPSCSARTTIRSATKRMCVDTGYFETYNRAERRARRRSARRRSRRSRRRGLRVGGEEFAFDTIVLATGFDAMTGALLARRPARPRRPVAAREVGGRAALVRSA